jgi:hypothetical protein
MGIGPRRTTPPYSVLDFGALLLILSAAVSARSSVSSWSLAINTNPTMKLAIMSNVATRKRRLVPENTGKTTTSDTSAPPVATAVATNAIPTTNIATGIQSFVRTGSTRFRITVNVPYLAF